jgi:hypothetical protein
MLETSRQADKQTSARAHTAPLLPHSLLREIETSQEPTLREREREERERGGEREE